MSQYTKDFLKVLAFCTLIGLMFVGRVHAAELTLGLNYLSGQHDTRNLNLGVKVPIFNKAALLTSKVRYGSHDNEIVQNQGYFRLGYDPKLSEHWSLWFYEQVGYDKPKEIDFESFTGGGPKYLLYETERSNASASLGYLYHYQEDSQINRLSFRLKGKHQNVYIWPWFGGCEISAVLFYQPNIENFDDYLANGEIGISLGVHQDWRLKWSIEDHYRSMLDEKNELLTSLSLVVEF